VIILMPLRQFGSERIDPVCVWCVAFAWTEATQAVAGADLFAGGKE
jgi:hypothetical protein